MTASPLPTKVEHMTNYETRGQWLAAATREIRPWFRAKGFDLPNRIKVGVGQHLAGNERTAAHTWASWTDPEMVNRIYFNPAVDTGVWAATVLVHELVHVWDDCASDHGYAFKAAAVAMGLTGNLLIPLPGPTLSVRVQGLAAELGEFPNR